MVNLNPKESDIDAGDELCYFNYNRLKNNKILIKFFVKLVTIYVTSFTKNFFMDYLTL